MEVTGDGLFVVVGWPGDGYRTVQECSMLLSQPVPIGERNRHQPARFIAGWDID
jgi:hypothetical protein